MYPSLEIRQKIRQKNIARAKAGLPLIIMFIVVHRRPHLDERAALYALQYTNQSVYANTRNAEIAEWDPSFYNDGRSEEEWLLEGVCFIGVRGGKWDDHPHEDNPNECAFTLVLNDLGYGASPAWRWLGRLVFSGDRYKIPERHHLGRIIKDCNEPFSHERIQTMVNIVLTALLRAHESDSDDIEALEGNEALCLGTITEALDNFATEKGRTFAIATITEGLDIAQASFDAAVQILENEARVCEVWNERVGRPLRFVAIAHTPNENLARAARACRHQWRADMVLQLTTTDDGRGQMTYISVNSDRARFESLDWLATQLRTLETEIDPSLPPISDTENLACDGELRTWYHHREALAIYAGTPTHPHAPRTRMSPKTLSILCRHYLQRCTFRPKPQKKRRDTVAV